MLCICGSRESIQKNSQGCGLVGIQKLWVEEWLAKAVTTMYEKARTVMTVKHGNSERFTMKVGFHEQLVTSPLL